MKTMKLEGIIPPMVTPFDDKEDVDFARLQQEAEFLFRHDIHGISQGGSTGEGALLSDQELRQAIAVIQQVNHNALPVVAGVIRNSTKDAVQTGLAVKDAGADALLVTPVFYHGATDEGNLRFFETIARKVELPLFIYNVVPGNQITPQLVLRLIDMGVIAGVKQVGCEPCGEMAAICGERCLVFSACDDMLYPTYTAGACGAIAAILTVAPQLCIDQWHAYRAGVQDVAIALHQRLYHVWLSYKGRPYPGRIKEVLRQLGRPVGFGRSPMMEPSSAEKEHMRRHLQLAGLLNEGGKANV